MGDIILPQALSGNISRTLDDARHITLVGGNGAGKSRFMQEMISQCGKRSYILSALSASFPERAESSRPGSVDDLFRQAAARHRYMRTDAVCELDKLIYMIFADELEYLLDLKDRELGEGRRIRLRKTKLDTIKTLWEHFFPGNRIIRDKGSLMFATKSGDDLIPMTSLSQGEKTVLYYISAVLYAMPGAVIFIDSPSLFIHPSIIGPLWDSIESLRPDCTFIYDSADMDFISSRPGNTCIWVKSYDSALNAWDYDIIRDTPLSEDIFLELAGSRKPVLFIEGDSQHSIDYKLYSLVFPEWNVRPLGSCDKVIETTRTFNDMKSMHHLRSRGIVDRDRRTEVEVGYLRKKEILVPEVAEVENIFLLENVIKVMAKVRGRDAGKVIRRIKKEVILMFRRKADQQALQHVRHKVKRDVECKIDARFSCITALETHLKSLVVKLEPRKNYNRLREQFAIMVRDNDYDSILRVFNHKPMLTDCGVISLLGYRSRDEYVAGVLDTLRTEGKEAKALRHAIRECLQVPDNEDIS